jgi:hypothetical protein
MPRTSKYDTECAQCLYEETCDKVLDVELSIVETDIEIKNLEKQRDVRERHGQLSAIIQRTNITRHSTATSLCP